MGAKSGAALFCVAAAILMMTPQARAQDGDWRRAESENFVVYSRGGERALRGVVQNLEHFNDLLHDLTGAERPETPTRLAVYLLRDESALRVVWPTVGENIRGFYTYDPESVEAFAIHADAGWEGGAQQILFHEYTHHFMMQYFRTAYPAWYVEGFAEYMSTAEFERGRTTVGRPSGTRAVTLVGHDRMRLLPTEAMLGTMPQDTDERTIFYAQSWLMTHYMFSTAERKRAFNAYMQGVTSGADPIQSFEAALGVSPEAFRGVLADYMRGAIPYLAFRNRELAESTITVTRMPRSADDLILLNARMRRVQGEDAELVERILQEAAQYPGDAYAARSAAFAELSRNPARARELAAPLIEANPQDFEAQYILGRSYFEEAETAEGGHEESMAQARRHFVRAFRANADHVPTLYYYVRTHSAYRLSDEVLDVLTQAHLLAPQVDEIRFNLAIQMMNAERFEEAAMLFRPIAYSPHGGEGAARARRYMEAAERGEMPEP
jgi:hypothetical protein